ncbi:uncharacterized protein LOC117648266 isoform X1 [Thrips palmi]|uniref:Uncharacterized protein LOC117648266 isoform X1 n=1 Tax=Thrips palmi TaxID=161013 RepID=A0A6P8Z8G4_THRPL|nr:uncharacterized protein LOC117648266 isoform X1 [Thrips palmi]
MSARETGLASRDTCGRISRVEAPVSVRADMSWTPLVFLCLVALQAGQAVGVEVSDVAVVAAVLNVTSPFAVLSQPQSGDYSDEDVKLAEALDRRLQRCLAGLPELGDLGPAGEAGEASDLPDVVWLPVAKLRQSGTPRRRRPADTCREEAMDVVWEEGDAEQAAAAATTCLLNHYQHVVHGVDGLALSAALRKSLDCVAAELEHRRQRR